MIALIKGFVAIFAILGVFGIPISLIIASYRYKMKKLELEGSNLDKEQLRELRQKIGNLMAENELLKDAVQDIQQQLGQSSTRIELSEYEKEQIRIDQENKGFDELF